LGIEKYFEEFFMLKIKKKKTSGEVLKKVELEI